MTTTVTPRNKLSIQIIGDAFVDYLCIAESLPILASDVRLQQPIDRIAGGSALNTTTHLQSLVYDFRLDKKQNDSSRPDEDEDYYFQEIDIMKLQTCFNPLDENGQILLHHANRYQFEMINCVDSWKRQQNMSTLSEFFTSSAKKESSLSTGHCVVITALGDRSFLTYLGVLSQFQASDLQFDDLLYQNNNNNKNNNNNDDSLSHNHHLHLHIAGYYNIQGFWNGALKTKLEWIRQQRHSNSNNDDYHNYTTSISLVPQSDATNQYNGQLLDILPFLDVLIMNEMEATCITGGIALPPQEKGEEDQHPRTFVHRNDLDIAHFFYKHNPQLYVIITLGSLGALVIQNRCVLDYREAPISFKDPVDTTGAGDAFVAGFLYGTIVARNTNLTATGDGCNYFSPEQISHGLDWGCVLGTSCTMRQGASIPSTKQEILVSIYFRYSD